MKVPYFDTPHYNKYFREENNLKNWQVFFDHFGKNHKMLDFGCGAAWSIYLGRKLGYDIVGLDTTSIGRFNDFNKFRKALGVDEYVKLYSGTGRLPFATNSLSLIVCRASFNKFHNRSTEKDEHKLAMERVREFSRVLWGPRIVVITGKYFKEEFSQFNLFVYNWSKRGIKQIWQRGSKKTSQKKAII
jgi:SAM-dependent methyltransferase